MAQLYEPIARGRGRQRAARIDRRLGVEGGQLLGLFEAIRGEHELARCLHVAGLAKLALDEGLKLGSLLHAVEDRGGGEAEGHVLQTRLAERVARASEVEQIVDDLRRRREGRGGGGSRRRRGGRLGMGTWRRGGGGRGVGYGASVGLGAGGGERGEGGWLWRRKARSNGRGAGGRAIGEGGGRGRERAGEGEGGNVLGEKREGE